MKKYFLIILLTMSWPLYAGHQTKKFLIHFATDQHVLDAAALKRLDEVTEFLKLHPNAKIKLTGRTDFDGTIGYNVALSRRRTNEVSELLKSKGFSQSEINEKWLGEVKPLSSNETEEGKSMNRSVEIEITVLNYTNAKEWLKENQKNAEQTRHLNSSGNNRIETNGHSIIDIPANAFVDESGKVVDNSKVKIVIKEVNSKMDAIINQVYTTSGDQLLETGGMMNIEAYSEFKKLKLAADKEISIQIPVKSSSNEMLVFEGVKDKNGGIDWKSTGVKFEQIDKQDKLVNKLDETELQKLIDQIVIIKPNLRLFEFNYPMPKLVKVPNKPREPKVPKEPEARSLFSDVGWLLSTKSMRAKRVANVHKKNMQLYQRRLDNYHLRLERYETFMETYKKEIAKFEGEKQLFYSWLRDKQKSISAQKEAWLLYHDKKRVHTNLLNLKVKSEKGNLFEARPYSNFKRRSESSALDPKQIEYLIYLSKLENSIGNLCKFEYETIYKTYFFNNQLKLQKLMNMRRARSDNYLTRENLMRRQKNQFLPEFVKANESKFIEIFGKETEEIKFTDQTLVANKKDQSQQYFVGNSRAMGWINCDRFVKTENVKISYPTLRGACQVIILAGINSILNAVSDINAEINSIGIPKNSKFKLVTFRIEGDQAYMSVVEAEAYNGLQLKPEFVKMPIAEADKILASL